MNNKADRIVGIAGFSESRELLEPSMNAVGDLLNIEDIEVFTVLEALADPEMLKMVTRGSVLLPRSAGLLALSTELEPAALAAFNAPYPVKQSELVRRAAQKTVNHSIEYLMSPKDSERRGVIAKILKEGGPGLLQRGNKKLLGEISEHSGAVELGKFKSAHPDIDVRSVVSLDDEIFPPSAKEVRHANDKSVTVQYAAGRHDEQLVDKDYSKNALKDLRIN